MRYNITETVDTVPWSEGVDKAPAELVKFSKDMAERGEPATFAKARINDLEFVWVILTVNAHGTLVIAKRNTEISMDS